MENVRTMQSSPRSRRSRARRALTTALVMMASFGLFSVEASARHDRDKELSFLWYIGGTHDLFECEVPPTETGATVASCHQHQLLDLRTDQVIGYALDATTDVGVDGDALFATGTTTFHITRGRYRGSVLQVRGTGTIQATVVGDPHFEMTSRSVEYDETPITHIAGIFPDPDDNQVLDASGAFEGAEGVFALFGGLDLSEADRATFNCIFKIDIEVPRESLRRHRRERRDYDEDDD